jgi:hypothetical protein
MSMNVAGFFVFQILWDKYLISIYAILAQIGNNKASLPGKQYMLRVCFKGWENHRITVRLGKINCQCIGT